MQHAIIRCPPLSGNDNNSPASATATACFFAHVSLELTKKTAPHLNDAPGSYSGCASLSLTRGVEHRSINSRDSIFTVLGSRLYTGTVS